METRWYSVKEALPETWSLLGGCGSEVLVHYRRPSNYDGKDFGIVALGRYCGGTRWTVLDCGCGGQYRYMNVAADYWMPIPSVPKGGAA